jgi:hypothetical protein
VEDDAVALGLNNFDGGESGKGHYGPCHKMLWFTVRADHMDRVASDGPVLRNISILSVNLCLLATVHL